MKRRLAVTAVLLFVLSSASVAYAAVGLYPGLGVSGARLGMSQTTAVTAMKKVFVLRASGVNNNYAGQRVRYYFYGYRYSNGHYPVEMYTKYLGGYYRAFLFEVNTSACVTSKGVHVGSTQAQLKTAYGTALTRRITPTYYIYSMGGRSNRTDFYVSRSTGRITRILISRY